MDILPLRNEILHVVRVFDVVFGIVFEHWWRLSYNICEQVDQCSFWLYFLFVSVGGERESVLRCLQYCNTQTPDITVDLVTLTSDSFRCHISGSANKCVGVTLCTE